MVKLGKLKGPLCRQRQHNKLVEFVGAFDELIWRWNCSWINACMQLGDAVANRSVSVVKLCYGDAAQALREVVAAVAPPAAAWCPRNIPSPVVSASEESLKWGRSVPEETVVETRMTCPAPCKTCGHYLATAPVHIHGERAGWSKAWKTSAAKWFYPRYIAPGLRRCTALRRLMNLAEFDWW